MTDERRMMASKSTVCFSIAGGGQAVLNFLHRFLGHDDVPTVTADDIAAKSRQGESFALLDVREADEWEAARIPGAMWIPLGELPQRMHELPGDREIICVCRSGGRSELAVRLLRANGYESSNLQGGMLDWPGEVESS